MNAVKSIDFVDSSVDVIQFPFSDGGEDALPVIQKHVAHKLIECVTQDAMGNLIKASYFINDNKTAWIELYKATGLADMPVEKRNITLTSTFGKVLMAKDAISMGCTEIILGSVEVPFESFIKHGFLDLLSILTKGMSLEYSKQNTSELIKNARSNLFSSFVNKLKKVK